MTSPLYAYSLIRVMYDRGADYLDMFRPFLLCALPEDGSTMSYEELRQKISETTGLTIPIHSLSAIINRAHRQHFVARKGKTVTITGEGKKEVGQLESERDVERRINELALDASKYLAGEFGMSLSPAEVLQLISQFVGNNIEFSRSFLDTITDEPARPPSDDGEQIRAILAYFHHVDTAKPAIYATLREVICGSILSTVVYSSSPNDATAKFSHAQVFLDTNIVFSILGLHHDETDEAASELMTLMKAAKAFDFRVFDFTVSEMVLVLKGYVTHGYRYLPGVRVWSIHSSLRNKGWSRATVQEFIVNIESHLKEHGIRVQTTRVDLRTAPEIPEERRTSLRQFKKRSPLPSLNHDLAAISLVRKLRKRAPRRIEDAKVMFLTSDMRLTRFNQTVDRHADQHTIGEVVPDRVLTNVLWLKSPKVFSDMPISRIISMHSRDTIIDRTVWDKFCRTIDELRETGRLDDEDLSILFYATQLENALGRFDDRDVGKINEGFVLKAVENAKASVDREKLIALEAKEKEWQHKVSEKEQHLFDEWAERVESAKRSIRADVEMDFGRFRLGTFVLMYILVVVLSLACLRPVCAHWSNIEPIAWVAAIALNILIIVAGFFGYRSIPKEWPSAWHDRIVSWMFERRVRKAHLVELETGGKSL